MEELLLVDQGALSDASVHPREYIDRIRRQVSIFVFLRNELLRKLDLSLGDLGLQILGPVQEGVKFAHLFLDLLLQSLLALERSSFLRRGAFLIGFGGLVDSCCGFSQRLVVD